MGRLNKRKKTMKLTKARLKRIIKEEIDAVSEAEQYMVKSSGDSELHRHAPDSYEMERGLLLIKQMKSDFPALIEILQIDDDILQQIAAKAVAVEHAVPGPTLINSHLFFTHVNKFLQEG